MTQLPISHLRRLFLIVSVVAIPVTSFANEPVEKVPPRKRVLLLGQKPDSHPATTHEYMAGVRLLARMLDKAPNLQTIVVQADSPWNDGPELLDGADAVVVFLTEGAKWVTEDPNRLAAMQRLAARKGGFACLHWGMGTKDAGPIAEFTALFGACHGGPDRKYKVVELTARPAGLHPILAGIKPFNVRDEFYYALKQAPPDRIQRVIPLILVPIDDADQSVAWAAERSNGGRSFGFSGLHYHDNWRLPEYRRLVLQGICWTIQRSIPETGMSVDVAPEDLSLPSAAK